MSGFVPMTAQTVSVGQGPDGRWHYRRSLASRVILLTTMAVGITAAVIAIGAYFTARMQMQDSLDQSLMERAKAAAEYDVLLDLNIEGNRVPSWAVGAGDVRIIYVHVDGDVVSIDDGPAIPLGRPELEVAAGEQSYSLRTVASGGERYRVAAVPSSSRTDVALVIAQSLEDQDRILARLGWVTLAFGMAGVLVAAAAGWAVASNGLRPVRKLTSSVEDIARTEDFTPLPVEGDDEVARLATAFNQMLTTLDATRIRQRQLVADAGHELRTPLTSLRTNIDLLTMEVDTPDAALPPDARREVLEDVRAQIEELTTLIGDLTELAREAPAVPLVEPVDLADIVDHAVQRVRRRAPGLTFEVFTRPWRLTGEAAALERAVTNLLDNAAKWSPEGGKVTVRLSDGVLTVDDQGPGIAEAHRELVFDRFWRAPDSRTMPGSGLGLSIVRQVVERHAGTVQATESAGGGTRLVMRLPGEERAGG